ncbi:hypothetical protein Syun_017466 [Stephania yunnanensis]|uniref:Uncharacterized protein n=1 Tax=Stephania yunnanensis TaxID=152371 RepID=A0AAP0J6Z2_9MAGN
MEVTCVTRVGRIFRCLITVLNREEPARWGGPHVERYILDSRGALVERQAVVFRERLIFGHCLVLSILVVRPSKIPPNLHWGFAELEYGMLRYMGAIDDTTPIVTSGMDGHDGRFAICIHASREKPVHVSQYFVGREIRSDKHPQGVVGGGAGDGVGPMFKKTQIANASAIMYWNQDYASLGL